MGKYHNLNTCNRCGGVNDTVDPSFCERGIYETKTVCTECYFEDYWSYGFYDSSQYLEDSKCKTYG